MLYAAGTNTSIGCPEVRSPMVALSVHTLEWFCRGCEDEASDVSEITYFIMNSVSSHYWDEISRRYAKSTKSYDNIGTLF